MNPLSSEIHQRTLLLMFHQIIYVISDTGSDDNTADIIKQFFDEKGIQGEIHYDEWVNFAHNRNCALQHAQGKTDYVLIFDADDRFEGNFVLPEELTSDRYYFRMANSVTGANVYFRTLMFRNDGSFYWRGVLHEFVEQRKKPLWNKKSFGDYMSLAVDLGHVATIHKNISKMLRCQKKHSIP